jgi:hypothetical protein
MFNNTIWVCEITPGVKSPDAKVLHKYNAIEPTYYERTNAGNSIET